MADAPISINNADTKRADYVVPRVAIKIRENVDAVFGVVIKINEKDLEVHLIKLTGGSVRIMARLLMIAGIKQTILTLLRTVVLVHGHNKIQVHEGDKVIDQVIISIVVVAQPQVLLIF